MSQINQRPIRRIATVCCVVLAALAASACSTQPSAEAWSAKVVSADRLRPLGRVKVQIPTRDFQKSFPGGTVVLRLAVDAEGRVRDMRIDQTSGNAALDAAAARSMVGATFVPYQENGVAIPVTTLMPLNFPPSGCIMAKPLDC